MRSMRAFKKRLVFLLLIVDFSIVSTNQSCGSHENSSRQIKNRLYEHYTDPDDEFTLYTVPCYPAMNTNNQSSVSRRNYRTLQDASCDIPQYGGPVGNDVALYARAECPWTYVIDYDAERIPKRIAKAVCSCFHCNRARGVCEPVNTYIPVIRKECESGTNVRYRKYIVEVPVGCVCIRGLRARTLTPYRTVMSH